MLDSLRNSAKSWVAKLLLGLLVLSFAVWGISGQMFTGIGSDVLKVGGTSVSVLDYRLAYDRQISLLSRQLGTRLTREQAVNFGLDDQVLQQLATSAVLDETARRMGLGVSQQTVAQLTASDPAFRGAGGSFDRRQFEFVLSQVGMRPEEYLQNRENDAIRQQVIDAVAEGVSAPDTLLRNVALYRGESRTIEYVPLPRSLVEPIEPPSDEELQSWFDERKDNYAAPEYRQINYVKLEPEDVADPSAISEEQIRTAYEQERNRYTTPERRTIERVSFSSTEEAEAARESLRNGATFEDIVERQNGSLEEATLGTLSQDEIADPAIAEEAFSLPQGQVSQVVEGTFGPVLLRVTEIVPEEATPLEEVSDEIRQQLALEDGSRVLLDTYDAYEDARAGGASMQEAANQQGLTMETVEAVDRSGRRPDGTVISDLPESQELLNQAFETEQGLENPPIHIGANGYLFYEVSEVTPARERTLDEVRDQVLEDWTNAEAEARLDALAGRLEEELEGGKTLDEIAEEVDQEKRVKRGLKRQSDDPDLGQAGVAAVFRVPQGDTGSFANPAGAGRFLFRVTEVFQPASASADFLPENVANSMSQGISNDLLEQLVTQLRAENEVVVNRAAMQQALNF
ncbi:SurA N-terminal domain-containing protein [Chelativorans sp. YIM 93263]|uniref:SurA N-terminal domain-containing protein n=1 Tax=Chelativorans sp. YIM 93263 TaxID=2906648 RepID=UPI002379AB9E|nr:SurA N-terminal domain-containing protein [Chelativorans sp. YIM 93263]